MARITKNRAYVMMRRLEVVACAVLLILVLLPWHTVRRLAIYGGLGPDNHIAAAHEAPIIHRGTEHWPITVVGPLAIVGAMRLEPRFERRSRRSGRIWAWFSGLLPTVVTALLLLATTAQHSCDKVEQHASEEIYSMVLVGVSALGVLGIALRPRK